MASTDVGSGSVIPFRASAAEPSNLASVPQIMYRSLQQTTIPPPDGRAAGRAGVTNDRIPLQEPDSIEKNRLKIA